MAIAGSLTYDTKIDKDGFKKGLNSIEKETSSSGTKIKNIVAGLGITKIIGKAFNLITSNMDSAIKRIDTLNNFPKVMSNLGISSEDSTKAVKKLSDGLKGIPTKLDDASLAVQRFTSINNDVNKSTDYFLAFNNALLAGGASTEIQANALEQLSQMYAVGTVDAQAWRSVQTAMPAQLQQVAESLGYTSTAVGGDFYNAMKSGKISMEDFMNQIVKLNSNGTGQFASFAEQAKSATGGIQTSIDNAKTAVSRGVASIVTSFDDMLKQNSLGGISTVISNAGNNAEKMLKKVSQAIPNVVSKIKDIYKWTVKNREIIKKVIIVIASLTAGYLVYKKVLIAIKTINMIRNITNTALAFLSLIPSITSAKDAMLLFNMICNLNPYALLIAGIVALTAATVGIIAITNKEKDQLVGLKSEVNEQVNSWNKLKQAREESLNSSLGEINVTQKLADELRKITDENGKVKDGYQERAQYIIKELNEALGTEYKMNDGIIQQYGELKNNIDQLIVKKKAEILLDAYKDEYTEALNKQSKATKTLADLRKEYNEALEDSKKKSNWDLESNKKINQIGNKIREQTGLIEEYGLTIQNYENLTSASVSGNADAITETINNLTQGVTNSTTSVNESLSSQIKTQAENLNAYKENYNEALRTHNEYTSGILENEKNAQQQQLDNLVKSLREQTSSVDEMTEDQKQAWINLAKTSTDEYKKALTGLPDETRNKVEEIAGTIENDTLVSTETKKLAEKSKDAFYNNTDGSKWGSDLVDNISNGMTSQNSKSKISNAASTVAGIIGLFLKHSVPKAGPLKDELTYMPDMIDNFAKGIRNNKYKVSNEIEKLTEEMSNKMQNAVAIETGSISTNAIVKSSANYNSIIRIDNKLEGTVNLDNKKLGRIQAPIVARTIKAGGLA